MKNSIIIYLFVCFTSFQTFGQDQIRRLNFILLIDEEIPIATIHDGCFLIKDSTGLLINRIPFNYKVVGLEFSSSNYKELSSLCDKCTLSISFQYTKPSFPFNQYSYESNLWWNEDYIIMHIYNKSKKENYEKYDFGKREYIVQIDTSYGSSILHYRADWVRKHREYFKQ